MTEERGRESRGRWGKQAIIQKWRKEDRGSYSTEEGGCWMTDRKKNEKRRRRNWLKLSNDRREGM